MRAEGSYEDVCLTHLSSPSFISRLLFSILPGEKYGTHTLNETQLEIVADIQRLYRDGFKATWPVPECMRA